jgi:hypothetical protein
VTARLGNNLDLAIDALGRAGEANPRLADAAYWTGAEVTLARLEAGIMTPRQPASAADLRWRRNDGQVSPRPNRAYSAYPQARSLPRP